MRRPLPSQVAPDVAPGEGPRQEATATATATGAAEVGPRWCETSFLSSVSSVRAVLSQPALRPLGSVLWVLDT